MCINSIYIEKHGKYNLIRYIHKNKYLILNLFIFDFVTGRVKQ